MQFDEIRHIGSRQLSAFYNKLFDIQKKKIELVVRKKKQNITSSYPLSEYLKNVMYCTQYLELVVL